MRPTRYKREFAVAQTVADMKRKFVYPDEDTQASPFIAGGGGGEIAVTVAASNASDVSKRKSDFECTGVADDQELLAAFEMANGGRIKLSEGTFFVTPNRVDLLSDMWLQGSGSLTTLIRANRPVNDSYLIQVDANSKVSDLGFNGLDGGAGVSALQVSGSVVWLSDIWTQNLHTGVLLEASDVSIQGLRSAQQTFAVRATQECTHVQITGCRLAGHVHLDHSVEALIDDNMVAGSIVGNAADRWTVTNNNFLGSIIFFDGLIELTGAQRSLVAGNLLSFGSNGDGITIRGDGVQVVGNSIGVTAGANIFIDGDRNHVQANRCGAGNSNFGILIASGSNDNAVYANYLGDESNYFTAAFVDNGTDTMTAPGANGQFGF